MILLDTSTKLELVLGDAATTEMDWAVTYVDTIDDTTGQTDGTSNDTTDVILVAAPASGSRLIRFVNIYNADSVAHDVTVKIDDTSNERLLVKHNLGVGKTLVYDSQSGWYEAFSSAPGVLLVANNLSDVASAATSRTNLGFTDPILDKANPGAIGGTTPAAIAGTTGTFSGLLSGGTLNVGATSPTISLIRESVRGTGTASDITIVTEAGIRSAIETVPDTAKTTMVDADVITLWDSAASFVRKKISGTNLKAYFKTANDLLYSPIAVPATGKTTMVDADMITLWDSAATWAKKNITGTNLKAYLLTYFAGIFSNPNILINSDGSDPISQQYTLPVTGAINGYLYIDAWVLGHNIVGQVDVSVESDGGFMAIASSYTSGSSLQLLHRVINYSALDGETVTFAAMVRSNNGATKLRIVSNGSTVASSSPHSGEGGFELLTVTADLASTLTAIFVDVISESITAAGQYIEWSYTKLEIGSVPTKWTRDANCELNATAIQARYQIIGAGLAGNSYNTTGITLSGTLPVKMLSTPTLSVLKSTMTIGDGSGSGKTSSGSTATYRGDASGFIADVIGFTSLTAPSDPVKLLTGEVFALDANI